MSDLKRTQLVHARCWDGGLELNIVGVGWTQSGGLLDDAVLAVRDFLALDGVEDCDTVELLFTYTS